MGTYSYKFIMLYYLSKSEVYNGIARRFFLNYYHCRQIVIFVKKLTISYDITPLASVLIALLKIY